METIKYQRVGDMQVSLQRKGKRGAYTLITSMYVTDTLVETTRCRILSKDTKEAEQEYKKELALYGTEPHTVSTLTR